MHALHAFPQRPLLVGAVIDQGSSVEVRGSVGQCMLRGLTTSERASVLEFLSGLDGKTPWSDLAPELELATRDRLIAALESIGSVVRDSADCWRWFQGMYANPALYPAPMSAAEAYQVERPGVYLDYPTLAEESFVPESSSSFNVRIRSLNFKKIDTSRVREFSRLALPICADVARRQETGHPYYSSAGAMEPARLAALVPSGSGKYSLWECHPERAVHRQLVSGISTSDVAGCFIQDDEIQGALKRAPIVFIIVAYLKRSAAKYGNRAWPFALIEVGQLSCRIELIANARGVRTRPVGGFCEEPMAQLLRCDSAVMLTLFAAFETP